MVTFAAVAAAVDVAIAASAVGGAVVVVTAVVTDVAVGAGLAGDAVVVEVEVAVVPLYLILTYRVRDASRSKHPRDL